MVAAVVAGAEPPFCFSVFLVAADSAASTAGESPSAARGAVVCVTDIAGPIDEMVKVTVLELAERGMLRFRS